MAHDWYQGPLAQATGAFAAAEEREEAPPGLTGRLKRAAAGMIARTATGRDFLFFRRAMASGYLYQSGWTESVRRKIAVERNGKPLPWLTYGAIELLAERVRPDLSVFEWGCGNSTMWWSARAAKVTSCENDPEWYRAMAASPPPNVTLLHATGDAYCKVIAGRRKEFDVIVIDGRDRVCCAHNCLDALRDEGVVIWDNSERPRYVEGMDFLTANGFKCLHFPGLGPVNLNGWRTSIFYRPQNCLGI